MSTAIPIILLGRQGAMGRIVVEHLQPELDTIHFITSPETAQLDLPLLLGGKQPVHPTADGIGTANYTRPAEAVILGLGYTGDVVASLRAACGLTNEGGAGVPWLVGGLTARELGEVVGKGYSVKPEDSAPGAAAKAKAKLLEVLRMDKGGRDGVYSWFEKN